VETAYGTNLIDEAMAQESLLKGDKRSIGEVVGGGKGRSFFWVFLGAFFLGFFFWFLS